MIKSCKTSFVKVHCNKCKNEQNVFSCVTSQVNCLVCNELLAKPTGGKSDIKGNILEILIKRKRAEVVCTA